MAAVENVGKAESIVDESELRLRQLGYRQASDICCIDVLAHHHYRDEACLHTHIYIHDCVS